MSARTAIVVGNGLVGACIALSLQLKGWCVTLIDEGDPRAAASFGNAGHLATEQCAPLASRANVVSLHRRLFSRGGPVAFPLRDAVAWLPFGLKLLRASSPQRFAQGTQAMTQLLSQAIPAWQRMAALAHASSLIRADGHFVVWETEGSAARGMTAWQGAPTGTARMERASEANLNALRNRFEHKPLYAARFHGTGQVTDLPALRAALMTAFSGAGGKVQCAHVVAVDDGVLLADGATLRANAHIVAAGIGSAALLKKSCGSIPLIAERGYHIEVDATTDNAIPDAAPVVFEDRNLIVAPFTSSLRVSGFTEFSRYTSPADPRKWQVLERHAREIGLFARDAKPRRWIGARPTLPDYLPALGQHGKQRNLFYAFGHNHLGVTLAAISGELMAACVDESAPVQTLSPFAIERF